MLSAVGDEVSSLPMIKTGMRLGYPDSVTVPVVTVTVDAAESHITVLFSLVVKVNAPFTEDDPAPVNPDIVTKLPLPHGLSGGSDVEFGVQLTAPY